MNNIVDCRLRSGHRESQSLIGADVQLVIRWGRLVFVQRNTDDANVLSDVVFEFLANNIDHLVIIVLQTSLSRALDVIRVVPIENILAVSAVGDPVSTATTPLLTTTGDLNNTSTLGFAIASLDCLVDSCGTGFLNTSPNLSFCV